MLLRRQEKHAHSILMGAYAANYGSQGERQKATYHFKQRISYLDSGNIDGARIRYCSGLLQDNGGRS